MKSSGIRRFTSRPVTGLILRLLALIIASLAAPAAGFPQTVGAYLQGTVTDPSGAAIPNAAVEIHNVETGVAHNLMTDAGGRWHEPVLPPGEYEIHVQAPGFQGLLRKGVHLAVGQEVVADVKLEISQAVTDISVAAEAATRINLTSGEASGLVDEKQMRDL